MSAINVFALEFIFGTGFARCAVCNRRARLPIEGAVKHAHVPVLSARWSIESNGEAAPRIVQRWSRNLALPPETAKEGA
ncbi:MAG TPA: hypothetical protein VKV05_09670 [Terriglobales bacterium]|nr:hypothetical protein [Terriglobales bacterium]